MAKHTILLSARVVITNATSEDVEIRHTPLDALVCYDRLTLVDHTSNTTSVHLGIKSGGSEFILDGKLAPGLNVPFTVAGKFFAPSYARPFARFVGASLGDKVEFFVYGYITDMPE